MKKYLYLIMLFIGISYSLYSQQRIEFKDYLKYEKDFNFFIKTDTADIYVPILPLLKKVSIYNKSVYGMIAIAYYQRKNIDSARINLIEAMQYGGDYSNMDFEKYFSTDAQYFKDIVKVKKDSFLVINKARFSTLDSLVKLILESDQIYRQYCNFHLPQVKVDSILAKQKPFDLLNKERILKNIDKIIDNYYYLKKATNISISAWAGHNDSAFCKTILEKGIAGALEGKMPWSEVWRVGEQLLFKYPYLTNQYGRFVSLDYIYTSNSNSTIDSKYLLQLYSIYYLLKDNIHETATLRYYDNKDNEESYNELQSIRKTIIEFGIPISRIQIQKNHLKRPDNKLKAQFALSLKSM